MTWDDDWDDDEAYVRSVKNMLGVKPLPKKPSGSKGEQFVERFKAAEPAIRAEQKALREQRASGDQGGAR